MTSDGSKPPIKRLTLTDQVRDNIVLRIASGELAPGAPLRELELAQAMGTSQSPVRDALRELAALGLVDTQRHLGARVRNFKDEDLLDGVPVRAMLESMAAGLAARSPAEARSAVSAAFDRLQAAASSGDRLRYSTASVDFHSSIVAAAGNDSLFRAWRALGIEVMTILAIAGSDVDLVESTEEHRAILDAILDGDTERAETLSASHQSSYLPSTHATVRGSYQA